MREMSMISEPLPSRLNFLTCSTGCCAKSLVIFKQCKALGSALMLCVLNPEESAAVWKMMNTITDIPG